VRWNRRQERTEEHSKLLCCSGMGVEGPTQHHGSASFQAGLNHEQATRQLSVDWESLSHRMAKVLVLIRTQRRRRIRTEDGGEKVLDRGGIRQNHRHPRPGGVGGGSSHPSLAAPPPESESESKECRQLDAGRDISTRVVSPSGSHA